MVVKVITISSARSFGCWIAGLGAGGLDTRGEAGWAGGNDVRALLERGDLTGEMSFGFFVNEDSWSKDRTQRLVRKATLVEVSIVQDAAYPQTSSSLRSVSVALADAIDARLATFYRRIRNV